MIAVTYGADWNLSFRLSRGFLGPGSGSRLSRIWGSVSESYGTLTGAFSKRQPASISKDFGCFRFESALSGLGGSWDAKLEASMP